jgi:hypothetical protein
MVEYDDSVTNGVVHIVNSLIQPTSDLLPDLIANDSTITLFAQALKMTGMADSLREDMDLNYKWGTDQKSLDSINEDNPKIDDVLKEALSTRIINRFIGYQRDSMSVINQVYALWNVLQRRHFKYSSISNSSLSSNFVFAQRIRTFDDAMKSSQINCVDGSVLFASLMRAINITPILVRLPNHMFVGFYTDKQHRNKKFIETTMIGDVNLDDYFPEENLDSTLLSMSQNQASRMAFEKSMEYAEKQYYKHAEKLNKQSAGYMYLEITSEMRKKIQPIGK